MSKNTVSAPVFAENDVIALELDGLVIIDQPLVTTTTWQNSLRSEIGKQSSYTRCVFWACVPQKIKETHVMSLWTFTQSDQPDPTTHVIQQWQRTEKKMNTFFCARHYPISAESNLPVFCASKVVRCNFSACAFCAELAASPRRSLPSAVCHAGAICLRKKNVRLRLLYFLLTLFLLIFVSSTLIWHRVKVHCYWNQNKKQQQKKPSRLLFVHFVYFSGFVFWFSVESVLLKRDWSIVADGLLDVFFLFFF